MKSELFASRLCGRRLHVVLALCALTLAVSGCEQDPADPAGAPDVASPDAAPDAAPDGSPIVDAAPDGAPADATADVAPDAAPDAARPFDPRAACEAATDPESCAAVELPEILDDDSWHRCLWFEQHRVVPGAETCEIAASEGRCVRNYGGEDPRADLSEVCMAGFSRNRELLYEERPDGVWVGMVAAALIDDPDLRDCGADRDPYGAHPACRCPCLPDYPNPYCEALIQRDRPQPSSGIEICTGVPRHRAAAVDCVAGAAGACTTDADCGPAQVCLCSHDSGNAPASVCVDADCATDADCGEGEVCAVSYEPTDNRCRPDRLACRRAHAFCDGVICVGDREYCAYDEAAAGWTCREGCRF